MIETIGLEEATEAKYWNSFYKDSINSKKFKQPSPFAEFCAESFFSSQSKKLRILDIGCGNGRDSIAFSALGHEVLGIDRSEFVEKSNPKIKNLNFKQLEISAIDQIPLDFDIIYCRFVLHSINEATQNNLLRTLFEKSNPNAIFLFEFRTDRDPLMQEGDHISENERITTHYRRFINTAKFSEIIAEIGFKVAFFVESNGLAKFENEDPVVARYCLRKS